MVYSSNLGLVDCTYKKCRVNGRVMDKFSLIEFMRHLDFDKFWYRLMYAYDIMTYSEIYELLEDYLCGDLD